MRNRDIALLILTVLITSLAMWVNFAPTNANGQQIWIGGRDVSTRLGLDLQGGTQVLLRADNPNVTEDEMEAAAGVINRRVNGLGVSEAVVQRSGTDRIVVELPGVTDSNQAIDTLRGTGRLEFIDTGGQFLIEGTIVRTSGSPDPAALRPTEPAEGTEGGEATGTEAPADPLAPLDPSLAAGPVYQSITDGADLDLPSVQPVFGGRQTVGGGQFAVTFAFRGESATNLAQFTSRSVGQPMCIVLDNVVFSCPVINQPLTTGSGEITTSTREDAEQIFNQLRYGALPISLQIESSRSVSASLGQDSVDASIVAGMLGLGVVVLFMILYYRLPGLLATLALLVYVAIVFALYRLIPVTLTLAGIAGFILSIGVAVDANVLIFARLKEELRNGRSLRYAVDAGFKEAWPAIRDSSVATLITSVILFMFGNGFGVSIIQGFALTLGLGIIISLFTAVTVSQTFLRLIAVLPIPQNGWLFGIETPRDTAGPTKGEAVAEA